MAYNSKFTGEQVDEKLEGAVQSTDVTNIVLVSELPDDPDEHTLYLIPEE